jgi:hypothetical protein
MVIDHFDIIRIAVGPAETDSPLVVDADAVPAFAIALQGFQPIARGYGHLAQFRRRVQRQEFPPRATLLSDPVIISQERENSVAVAQSVPSDTVD